MKIPLMDITACYPQVKEEITDKIHAIIDSSSFIGGKEVEDFEKEFAKHNGTNHCIACSNGTDAITIALKALGVGKGDTVLVPANTFIATAEAVSAAGAEVAFVDTEEKYYTIDPNEVERFIKKNQKKKIRAVIPVHLYGQMADMISLRQLADRYNFFLVEDAAQAHGALFQGKGPGIWGDAATYSFFPGKNLGAFGDAGGITTNNQDLGKVCKMLTNHGRAPGKKYIHSIEGMNNRMDSIQAAVLRIKLKYLDSWNSKRRINVEVYNKNLNDIIAKPAVRRECVPVWYVYTIEVRERDSLIEYLTKNGISTGIYYPVILPLQPAYKIHKEHCCPVSARQADRILSLPMYPELSEELVECICSTVLRGIS